MSADTAASTKCVCTRNEGGACDCICEVPCPGKSEGKTMEWTCDCSSRGKSCACKFQLKCTRKDGEASCGGQTTEVINCDCSCGAGECRIQVKKCACCEITKVGCSGCEEKSGENPLPTRAEGCCEGGNCCKN